MAKLSARGRKELVRVSKERVVPEIERCILCSGSGAYNEKLCSSCSGTGNRLSLISWERTTIALMSDGKILSKRTVVFRADKKRHDYGWTVKGKAKPDVTPEVFSAAYTKIGFTEA